VCKAKFVCIKGDSGLSFGIPKVVAIFVRTLPLSFYRATIFDQGIAKVSYLR